MLSYVVPAHDEEALIAATVGSDRRRGRFVVPREHVVTSERERQAAPGSTR